MLHFFTARRRGGLPPPPVARIIRGVMLPMVVGSFLALATEAPPWSAALVSRASPGLDRTLVEAIHSDVRATLERTGSLQLQSAPDTGLGMDQAGLAGWKCDDTPRCLAQLGRSLAVRRVVLEQVQGTTRQPQVVLSVVDVALETMAGTVTVALPDARGQWPLLLRSALETLPIWGGVLRFHFSRPAAELTVDTTRHPQPAQDVVVTGLSPATHHIRVVTAELAEVEADIVVAPGTVQRVWVSDEPSGARITFTPVANAVTAAPGRARTAWIPVVAGGAGLAAVTLGSVSLLAALAAGALGGLVLRAQPGLGLALGSASLAGALVGVMLGVLGVAAVGGALTGVVLSR